MRRFNVTCSFESKHLKGRLDPRVGDGHVFCIKSGQLDLPVGDGHFFCIKGGQLDPPVGDSHIFCIKGGQLDPPVGDGHVFCIKGGQLDSPVGDVTFFSSWRSVGATFFMVFHGSRLVFMFFLQNVPAQTVSWPNDPV